MAVYDGGTVRIKTTVTDFDGIAVTNEQVETAVVALYDTGGNYVPLATAPNAAMTYDAGLGYWYYDWQDALPGSFTALCTFTGVTFVAFGYGKVLVSSLRVVPTGDPTSIVN